MPSSTPCFPNVIPLAQGQWYDVRTFVLLAVIVAALGIATIVSLVLSRREKMGIESALIRRFKEGEQDPISEWFASEYSYREFRGRGHEMLDRLVDKLES